MCWGQSSGVGAPPGAGGWAQPERGLQPSAGQQRDSLDGGRDPALSWIPALEETVPPARSQCGSWLGRYRSLDSLGGKSPDPRTRLERPSSRPCPWRRGGDSWSLLGSQDKWGSRKHFSSLRMFRGGREGSPLKSPSHRRHNVYVHQAGCPQLLGVSTNTLLLFHGAQEAEKEPERLDASYFTFPEGRQTPVPGTSPSLRGSQRRPTPRQPGFAEGPVPGLGLGTGLSLGLSSAASPAGVQSGGKQ